MSHYCNYVATYDEQVAKIIWHKAASPPHTDGSIVFARRSKYASHKYTQIVIRTVPVLPPAESLWTHQLLDMSKAVVPRQNKIILKNFSVYFNMEPPLKWNKIILAAKIISRHFRRGSMLK